jgi:hypothetical protein
VPPSGHTLASPIDLQLVQHKRTSPSTHPVTFLAPANQLKPRALDSNWSKPTPYHTSGCSSSRCNPSRGICNCNRQEQIGGRATCVTRAVPEIQFSPVFPQRFLSTSGRGLSGQQQADVSAKGTDPLGKTWCMGCACGRLLQPRYWTGHLRSQEGSSRDIGSGYPFGCSDPHSSLN